MPYPERVEKVAKATLGGFARVCMHAFGVHWPLEKCKRPRTGRGFLRIGEGQGICFSPVGSIFRQSERVRPIVLPSFLLLVNYTIKCNNLGK